MDEKTFVLIVVALFIGVSAIFISCSGEDSGMLKPSETVTANFKSFRPSADLDYWFSGPESYPIAIIGVEKRLRFDSAKHWIKVGPGEDALKRLIEGMHSKALQLNQNLCGFEIVNQRGERVGEWYSTAEMRAVIKRTGIDSVEIWPPSPGKVEP